MDLGAILAPDSSCEINQIFSIGQPPIIWQSQFNGKLRLDYGDGRIIRQGCAYSLLSLALLDI